MEIFKGHFILTSANDIAQICKPLFDLFGVTYFEFTRVYKDGSRAILTNNGPKVKFQYEVDYKESLDYDHALFSNTGNCVLWMDGERFLRTQVQKELIRRKITDSINYFNINNGIAFFERHTEYVDYYNFGANASNESIIPLYFSYHNEIKLFIAYFKEKAQPLIKQALKNRIMMPSLLNNPSIKDESIQRIEANKQRFYKSINTQKFYIEAGSNIYLTRRELECLAALARGLSQKEIAQRLKVSPRTTEYFLGNIKRKLRLLTTSQLIEFYWRSVFPDINFENTTKISK